MNQGIEAGPHVEGSTWNHEVSLVNQFYEIPTSIALGGYQRFRLPGVIAKTSPPHTWSGTGPRWSNRPGQRAAISTSVRSRSFTKTNAKFANLRSSV